LGQPHLRWKNLNSARFCHLKLLLFWPVFGLLFSFVERVGITNSYHIVSCALDGRIPFCEYFLVPYLFWFIFLIGMLLYTLFFEVPTFKRFMKYIIITYSITILIYFVYPTAQDLRPAAFARDDPFTRFLTWFYAFDTNTNVCPSIHVVGSLAVMFAAWNSGRFHTVGWRIVFGAAAALICVSTVFLKQHSVIDIAAALLLCLAVYPFVYGNKAKSARPVTRVTR